MPKAVSAATSSSSTPAKRAQFAVDPLQVLVPRPFQQRADCLQRLFACQQGGDGVVLGQQFGAVRVLFECFRRRVRDARLEIEAGILFRQRK